jgi:serine/threonine protein kinase
LLGSGGSGDVYLAADRQLSEQGHEALVAIKVLAGDRGPWARQRLIDEATKARRVTHANVVRVLDRGVSDDDEDFVVYEHVAGGDLGEWLDRRPQRLSARDAASLMSRIARGVHAAHAAGLVHCDLKPGNVLMTAEGEPRVADFGIAVRADDEAAQYSGDREQPIGNIAFIAPEQFRMQDGCFSIAADVYALGGMLYYLVTRATPQRSVSGRHRGKPRYPGWQNGATTTRRVGFGSWCGVQPRHGDHARSAPFVRRRIRGRPRSMAEARTDPLDETGCSQADIVVVAAPTRAGGCIGPGGARGYDRHRGIGPLVEHRQAKGGGSEKSNWHAEG